MGHTAGKDIYKRLGRKIDNLTVKAPWNNTFYEILKILYTPDEARVCVKMPYTLSNLERIARVTGYNRVKLQNIIDRLCSKGLMMDFWILGEYQYMLSPIIIGIFEFTMMRTGNDVKTKQLAKLFNQYLTGDDSFFAANFQNREKISLMRALPHEEAVKQPAHIEILDYESAFEIIDRSDRFSIGLCSCRHEKIHTGKKECNVPLDTCSSFGFAADYLIRHNLAKEVSKSEMKENIARSKELGLVLNADNVKQNITFICQCCKCCCNALLGISRFGFKNVVVTSTYIASIEHEECKGCGKCVKACPINAIEMKQGENSLSGKEETPEIDRIICLGCGVCALKCETGALQLVKRGKRVIHPETTFKRVILQSLERGTLVNQIFDNPQSITESFMRCFIGGFLKIPYVKKALMSDIFRSSFLEMITTGVKLKKNLWVTKI